MHIREALEMLCTLLYVWGRAGLDLREFCTERTVQHLFGISYEQLRRYARIQYAGKRPLQVLQGDTRACQMQLLAAMYWALGDAGFGSPNARKMVRQLVVQLNWRNECLSLAHKLSYCTAGELKAAMHRKLSEAQLNRRYYGRTTSVQRSNPLDF